MNNTSKCRCEDPYCLQHNDNELDLSQLNQMMLEAKLPTAKQYKAHTMVLHITDGLLAFVGLMTVLSVAHEALPLIAGIVICAALGLTSWANHASR